MKQKPITKTNTQMVESLGVPKIETNVDDPIVKRLDLIIELLGSIKVKVDSIKENVPKPFDVSRLVKD